MAKQSARSFDQYSGLDQGAQNQPGITPNAQQRLGDPAATRALQDTNPSALGLSDRPATPSGRSFYDPARQAERWVRGTGSREQTSAAAAAQGFNEAADPIGTARQRAFGPPGRGILGAGPLAGYDVTPSTVSQSVADPGPPVSAPQAPSLFNQSMRNPAQAQSLYSIGNALGGSGLTAPKNPFKNRIPNGIAPQIFL